MGTSPSSQKVDPTPSFIIQDHPSSKPTEEGVNETISSPVPQKSTLTNHSEILTPRTFPEMESLVAAPLARPCDGEHNSPTEITPMVGLQTIEDFDKENPYVPKQVQKHALVVLPSKATSDNVVKFQHLCDWHGIRPDFDIRQTYTGGFTASVKFGEQTIKTTEAHPSKKAAKDAVCKLALECLSATDKQGTKRKGITIEIEEAESEPEERWGNTLHDYVQGRHLPVPKVTDYASTSYPVLFGCEVSVDVAGAPNQFGSSIPTWRSKKLARSAAAKEAVLWLRANGVLCEPPKQQKTTHEPATPINEATAPTKENTGPRQDVPPTVNIEPSTSFTVQIQELCRALGFSPPRFNFQQSMSDSGDQPLGAAYWDTSLYFAQRDIDVEPRLQGQLGLVRRIYGKQTAKNACCAKVAPFLEDILCAKRARLGL